VVVAERRALIVGVAIAKFPATEEIPFIWTKSRPGVVNDADTLPLPAAHIVNVPAGTNPTEPEIIHEPAVSEIVVKLCCVPVVSENAVTDELITSPI
jgi:hypothetical protein